MTRFLCVGLGSSPALSVSAERGLALSLVAGAVSRHLMTKYVRSKVDQLAQRRPHERPRAHPGRVADGFHRRKAHAAVLDRESSRPCLAALARCDAEPAAEATIL